MNILIIGAGGREHALAWKFAQESRVQKIYVAPGNAGTAKQPKCQNVELTTSEALLQFALDHAIDLTMVGSEALLAEGIVDDFQSAGLTIFGPHQKAAELESSKAFAKAFMQKYGVKTADYQVFSDADSAKAYLQQADYPIVVKADGLAAGKGVVIAQNQQEAIAAVDAIMTDKIFQSAGDKLVIETFLEGVEASILSFTDGQTILPMLSAKDHKKIGEGETGLNTGGMGVVCPNPYVTDAVNTQFIENILEPTAKGLQAEGMAFAGVIFFGLMITRNGVYLLEYNMRMGDPETQAVLPLLDNSLTELIDAALAKKLNSVDLEWRNGATCCVVLAAEGYPEAYKKGEVISGIEQLAPNTQCFIAGASENAETLVTSGGRVLNVVSHGSDLAEARTRAYDSVSKVHFNGMTYRRDIGVMPEAMDNSQT